MVNMGTTVGSSFSTAASSISDSIKEVREASQQVVESTTTRPVEGSTEISKSLITMKESTNLVAANGKVIEAADQQLGTLLDVTA